MTTTPDYDRWLTSRRFWTDTLERIIRTTAQVALGVFGLDAASGITDTPGLDVASGWEQKLAIIGVTAVFTLVTCLAGRRAGDTSTASLTRGTGE